MCRVLSRVRSKLDCKSNDRQGVRINRSASSVKHTDVLMFQTWEFESCAKIGVLLLGEMEDEVSCRALMVRTYLKRLYVWHKEWKLRSFHGQTLSQARKKDESQKLLHTDRCVANGAQVEWSADDGDDDDGSERDEKSMARPCDCGSDVTSINKLVVRFLRIACKFIRRPFCSPPPPPPSSSCSLSLMPRKRTGCWCPRPSVTGVRV